jgi:coenzyme F420-0:L-glutamate ligase/coenzyme F420-1:gamma-L-glutamate ligase
VVAHKVVSKAEGRVRRLGEIEPGERARELAAEHRKDARLVQAVLDESNSSGGGDELVLLPEDPDRSASALRAGIEAARGVRPAVVISDSFGRAWRLGQTDVAIGAAGLTPLDQWIGRGDAFGRELRVTSIAVADSIAAAADLARAKDSLEPVVLVRGLERYVSAGDGPGAAALRRPAEQDLFR